jgi:hypothetical protein
MGKTYKSQGLSKAKSKSKKTRNKTKGILKTAVSDLPKDKDAYYELDYPEDNFEKFDRKR